MRRHTLSVVLATGGLLVGLSAAPSAAAGTDPAFAYSPTHGPVGTVISISGGGCSGTQTGGDAIALFRVSDNAYVDVRTQLGNDAANRRPWATTLRVNETLFTPANEEQPTTPGSYVLALYCNIGSSFHVPGIGQPPTTPAEADLTKPFTVDATIDTAGAMTSVAPARLMDTRSGNGAAGPVAAKATAHLQVLGRGGVPATGVSAVVLNVTVTQPTAAGFLTVFADGAARPTASNLNFVKGQTVPNLVVAPVGGNGKVALYNGSAGSVQMIADVAGYFRSGAPSVAGAFGSLAPARLMDTRSGNGAAGPVAAKGTAHLQVLGRGGVPATGVSAVVMNVTVTQPMASGFLTVFADGAARPTASNLNFVKGQTVPNLVVAPVGANGKVALYNGSSGSVQLVADVAGYYRSGAPTDAGTFGSLAPARLMDTRSGTGAAGPVAANTTAHLQVLGQGGVPATGVSAIVMNVTVTGPTAAGFLTVFADDAVRPTASNLNFVKGQTVPNLVVAPVGANGKVALYNGSSGSVQMIADVAGYVLAP